MDHELRTGVTEANAMSALDLIIGGGGKHLMKICSFLTVSFPQSWTGRCLVKIRIKDKGMYDDY